ncbi:class I SAM-dependent methyltransferase [Actinokineospora diospyrosa]|uniref:Methyltransferase domain-containing protein n=1 Tax=Actinokineospora diospyrosa TaxID=103728 RepID=A0ABT1IEI8_9PSEU|nr:class I SAM-dependent methyltransferase [Actinokineospora diospyrosa]MCP2270966.1 Methyltransferase domain-containing protein [Actinokineospora diospyrosa]
MTGNSTDHHPARDVAEMFNSAVAAFALSAAWELGALDELRATGDLDAAEFAAGRGLDTAGTLGMFRALAAVRVVERDGTTVTPGARFAEAVRNRSFFHWLARGSSELFREMPSVLVAQNRVGEFYRRDPAAIALACREIDELCYAPTFWAAMGRLDFPVRRVVDLGCGSGGRLIDVLRSHPGSSAVGIDIARPSLEVARKEVAEAGFGDRAGFVEADVLALRPHPDYADVELLLCFMMGHDFWPRDNCVATLRRLREVFPAARRFLLGDATRTVGVPDTELPVFTLGFEVGHDLMGTFIPTIADWESVFAEGGWELVRTNRIGVAVGEVVFELAPR